ncbi:hypothetical protein BH11ACT5_BH11ACT5_14080 [soil metagenome]
MRRFAFATLLVACGLLVSSCGLLPFGGGLFDTSHQKADAQMEDLAQALSEHDAEALEGMFSPYALQLAKDVDQSEEYLFSFFPIGEEITWQGNIVNVESHSRSGEKSELLQASYKVSVGGKDMWLFFADFTVNGVENPDNVGIYGLGVTPWTEDRQSGASRPFFTWAGAIHLEGDGEYGYPGIYVPNDDIVYPFEEADARMEQIANALNNQDEETLKALFSLRALEKANGFDRELRSLFAEFSSGGVGWEQLDMNVTGVDGSATTKVLTPRYRLTAGGEDYWLFFADFVVDTADPDNVGLASLAVTPWFEPGASDADQNYIDWTATWGADSDGLVGIYTGR